MADWLAALHAAVDRLADDLIATRRHLHSHPEPSREEYRTAAYIAAALREAGIPHRLVASERGVIAGPEAHGATGRVAFRADTDALRIPDRKDTPYRSSVPGVLHGCGHDAHTAMALGACRALWDCRDRLPWPVPWRAVFQPAEEVGEGAAEMVAAGALEGVRAIVALHVDPDQPVGTVSYRFGPMTAACSDLEVSVVGSGGHAARPHQTADPIAAAAQFVSAVYQTLPRSWDAREATVVSFGSVRGGQSHNVIPDRVELLGTVRTLSLAAAARVEDVLRRVARGVGETCGVGVEVRLSASVGPVVNDEGVTRACEDAVTAALGREALVTIPLPSMGAEDFAAYLAFVPGCMMRLGVAHPERPRHPLHSPYFDLDERALTVGAKVLAGCAVRLSDPARPLPGF